MIHEWIGYIAAICTTGAMIPQVMKAYRTRHTRDLSFGTYTLSGIGVAIWLVYGWLTQDMPLIAANAISLVLVVAIITIKFKDGD